MSLSTQPHSLGKSFAATLFCFLVALSSGTLKAQVSVTATSGATGPTSYTTVKGAFDAINLGTHQGVITLIIGSNTTEVATAVLNASGTGSASFTRVLIQPDANTSPVISGSIASAPIIKINGASNVTINGSNNNTTTRDLTITNTNTTTPQVVVIGSVGTTPATNDTLKNCVAINGANTSTCIIVSDATTPGSAGYFNNIALVNNNIQKAYIGTYLISVVTGTNGSGTYVANNQVNSTGTSAVRLCGLYLQGLSGALVTNNVVGNFESTSAEFDRGIWLATGTNNTTVSGNTVTGLSYTGATTGYAPIGINISPAATSANLSITGNTVNNISSTSTGTSIGIYFFSAASGVTINKNQISNIKNSNTGGWGAAGIYLTGTLTASAVDVINNFVSDIAAYGTNLWTANANGNGIVADGGGGYNIYYNTVLINTNQTATTGTRAAAVLITTNVTATASINLRNNLLINTQTIGNANSRLAFAITASPSVLNTCNYNDYYSVSTNLVGQGTNPTIWNTIAQVQSNIGSNTASVSILPVFTSSTDLHLPVASNSSLNNIGVSITGYTTDIDNDPRTATPDMGADEFGNCLPVTITTQPVTLPICSGTNTSFTAAGTNANVIQWQVNTGSGFTNVTNGGVYGGATTNILTITGAAAGMNGYIYQALLSYASFCPATTSNSVTLTVNQTPSVAVTSSGSTAFCTGGSTVLSVPSATGLTYQWRNASGNISGATTPSLTVSTTGNYSVTVANPANGCSASSTPPVVVTVGAGPAAVISPAGNVSICSGKNTTLSAGTTSGVTYQWLLNGTPISGASANTYTTNTGGIYTVQVSTSPTCNTMSVGTAVNVMPLPLATAAASSSTTICQGTSVMLNANTGTTLTYQWLFNGSPVTGATGSSYSANAPGAYRVKVADNVTTCVDTTTAINVVVNPLPAAAITPTAPVPICEGDTSILAANAGSGLNYQWQLNGSSIAGANAISYKAFLDGIYTVQTTDVNGCSKVSAQVPLTVHPAPAASITYNSPLAFCDGGGVVFNVYQVPGVSYQWIKDGTNMPGVTANSLLVTVSGSYTIRVTDILNCVAYSPPVPVTVYPKPAPVVSFNGSSLTTGSYSSYQWFLNNATIGGATAATLNPAENGAYKVMVRDANGCEGISDLYFFNSLGTGGLTLNADIQVYPNPATTNITVDNRSSIKLRSVSLVNGLGSTVYSREVSGIKENISTEQFAAGIYYLRVQTDAGVLLKKVHIIK